ncbi:MAG: hypothetical protein FDZ70_07310 [Actinobacteria bacterium]|nr:MAG: hypothetical protein FDZ70_07310 [Actinomycetota bacterium]
MSATADRSTLRVADLVEMLNARCEVRVLRPDLAETAIAGLKPASAAAAGDVAFVKSASILAAADGSCASLLIVPAGSSVDEAALAARGVTAIAYAANPRLEFALVGTRVAPRPPATGVSPAATVDARSVLGEDVSIAAGCVIGAAEIGAGTSLGPNCVVIDGCVIGSACTIGASVTIGAEGFGYERDESGYPVKFPHVGSVRIGDRVDIGAGTVLDRGALGDTVVGDGTKIDNLCHIAHNVSIGVDTMIVAHAMIGGSARIGDRAWIGPGALVRNGLTVGDDAFVSMGSVVTRDVEAGQHVTGNFAIPHARFIDHLRGVR